MSFVYNSWFDGGPGLRYQLTAGTGANPGGRGGGGGGGRMGGGFGGPGGGMSPTYAELMTTTDGTGKARSYLATEEASSVFIRSARGGTGFELSVAPIAPEVAPCRGR